VMKPMSLPQTELARHSDIDWWERLRVVSAHTGGQGGGPSASGRPGISAESSGMGSPARQPSAGKPAAWGCSVAAGIHLICGITRESLCRFTLGGA
jgi:hypothetical protein